jgi:hypothetical protein
LIVGFVLIGLMLFSTIGFAFSGFYGSSGSDEGETQDTPYFNGNYWIYPLGGQEYYFTNSIESIEFDELSFDLSLNQYVGKNLYIDSENEEVLRMIGSNLGRFADRVQEACYGECERDLPEKECSENIIVYKDSEEENVVKEDNCIFIDGSLKTVDSFLYRVLGFN